jgi:hypothetical protein
MAKSHRDRTIVLFTGTVFLLLKQPPTIFVLLKNHNDASECVPMVNRIAYVAFLSLKRGGKSKRDAHIAG